MTDNFNSGYDIVDAFENMDILYRNITIVKGFDWDILSEDARDLFREKYTSELQQFFGQYLGALSEVDEKIKKDINLVLVTGIKDRVLLQKTELIKYLALGMQAYIEKVIVEGQELLKQTETQI